MIRSELLQALHRDNPELRAEEVEQVVRYGEVRNPATDTLLAKVPLGGAADVDRAVQAALKAYPAWRATPPVQRMKPLFRLKGLLDQGAITQDEYDAKKKELLARM